MCGLKHQWEIESKESLQVTPFVGVWIETKVTDGNMQEYVVTPFVGVWIETSYWSYWY